ncbi:hypothetical protein [Streptomyces sp. NPDC097619]|uniref:hypothetical protein n=1 Tax=Streptomyces sp. NPDC097619 TaxID=3157228 RepID=UPI00331DE04A
MAVPVPAPVPAEQVATASRVTVAVPGLVAGARPEDSGALWRLRSGGRQLDANLVRHLPGTGGTPSTETDVDVVLLAVSGSGTLTLDGTDTPLRPGLLAFLPRGATRAVSAGADGLVVLTVHGRRRGMSIAPARPGTPPPPCAVHLVCVRCHRHAIEADARYCTGCGTPLPARSGS